VTKQSAGTWTRIDRRKEPSDATEEITFLSPSAVLRR
jgi:hypothetical protein